MKRPVLITGIGCVTAFGGGAAVCREALLAGRSGVRPISGWDCSAYPVRFAAEVPDAVVASLTPRERKHSDPFVQYALVAAAEAMQDAGLTSGTFDADRAGVVIGSALGGFSGFFNASAQIVAQPGIKRVSPFFIPATIGNMAAGQVAITHGLRGPNLAHAEACAAGLHSIGNAAGMIARGEADIMVCGGGDYASAPLSLAGFAAARALSTRNDSPSTASRPWDRQRDGFVLGDGAAIVVLEAAAHAQARGVTPYAQVVGYGATCDAHHITKPLEDGTSAIACMQRALNDAQLSPTDIDYIHAHGTSTPVGDRAEAQAIRTVFPQHNAYVGSTKSMTGHLLGGAGALATLICAFSLQNQVIAPTINLDSPDDDCALPFAPKQATTTLLRATLCNAFGFGGTNASLVLTVPTA